MSSPSPENPEDLDLAVLSTVEERVWDAIADARRHDLRQGAPMDGAQRNVDYKTGQIDDSGRTW